MRPATGGRFLGTAAGPMTGADSGNAVAADAGTTALEMPSLGTPP